MVFQRISVVRRTPGVEDLNTHGACRQQREEGKREAIPRLARKAGTHRALWEEAKPWRQVLRSRSTGRACGNRQLDPAPRNSDSGGLGCAWDSVFVPGDAETASLWIRLWVSVSRLYFEQRHTYVTYYLASWNKQQPSKECKWHNMPRSREPAQAAWQLIVWTLQSSATWIPQGNLLNLPKPQFPHLQNGDKTSTHKTRSLWWLNYYSQGLFCSGIIKLRDADGGLLYYYFHVLYKFFHNEKVF